MKDNEINNKIKEAFSHAAPDILDSVLSDCSQKKGTVIYMTENGKSKRRMRLIIGIAACLLLLLGGFAGYRVYDLNYAVDSTVSLDVNPSIEIKVNQKERILDVTALNEDGKKVIGDMDFKGSSIDVTVNALIGSMLKNGYLNELANSVLISVDNKNTAKGSQLQARLTDEVGAMLQTESFTGSVLSQTISNSQSLSAATEKYGITEGKAQLINEILKKDSRHTFEDLAKLTINELNLLMNSGAYTPDNISSVGSASDKAYIGQEKAKAAAIAHAGLSDSDVSYFETDMDTENGIMVYEVEFKCDGYEYEYDINALTGEIVKYSREKDDDYFSVQTPSDTQNQQSASSAGNSSDTQNQQSASSAGNSSDTSQSQNTSLPQAKISADEAKEIALAHASVAASEAAYIKVDTDYDDGRLIYEVEFVVKSIEYEYEIDADSGNILDFDREIDD